MNPLEVVGALALALIACAILVIPVAIAFAYFQSARTLVRLHVVRKRYGMGWPKGARNTVRYWHFVTWRSPRGWLVGGLFVPANPGKPVGRAQPGDW